MKTVMQCDEVFDALTRGPFPSGRPDDPFVDSHLRACHECRQLAEALRPAVGLFHESLGGSRDAALPSYQGAIQETCQSISVLANEITLADKYAGELPLRMSSTLLVKIAGLLAVIVLFAFSLAGRSGIEDGNQVARTASSARAPVTLASLGIPLSCLPERVDQVDLTQMQRANLLLTPSQQAEFACCTRCHFSGGAAVQSRPAMQKVMIACATCHRAINT